MRSKPGTPECTDKHIFCITIITHVVVVVALFIVVIHDLCSKLKALVVIFMWKFILILRHLNLFLLIPSELKDSPRHFRVKNYLSVACSVIYQTSLASTHLCVLFITRGFLPL